ncbi:MAG: hypothetical protein IH913_04755 [Proteobacteria bacterium]|nr:hypothetical protein [Pseudomonadota bacterium]
MGTDENNKDEFAQRDKELRARIFDSLFTRLTWLDAAAIAAISAYLSSSKLTACPALFAKLAVASFAVSLTIELYVPVRRAWASFDTETLDKLGWFLQRSATWSAILGVIFIAVGVFLI